MSVGDMCELFKGAVGRDLTEGLLVRIAPKNHARAHQFSL